jgi:AraC-like DNA-binding protein
MKEMVFKLSLHDIIALFSVFQLAIFIYFLLLRSRRLVNILLAIFLFSQFMILINGLASAQGSFFHNNFPHIFFIGYPFYTVAGPSIYLYVKSLAYSDFSISRRTWLHLIPFAVFVLLFTFTYHIHSADVKRAILQHSLINSKPFHYSYNVFFLSQILVYNLASIVILKNYQFKLKQQYSSISHYNLAWLRIVIYGFIFSWLMSSISFVTFMVNLKNGLILSLFSIGSFFVFFNIIFFKGLTHPQIFSDIQEKPKYLSSTLSRSMAQKYVRKLKTYMRTDRPYLDPELNLKEMAEKLDIPPRHLSQVLNEHFGQNFYDFISRHRIEECKKVLSRSITRKTVLEAMYEVGFNSKSAFNAAFKKYTGMTPSEYKTSLAQQ